MAEREGFEPSIPLLAEYSLSRRAPSANSGISPFFRQISKPMYLAFYQTISKNHEASCVRKISPSKFLSIFPYASHFPYIYNLHKKSIRRVYEILLIALLHNGVFVICLEGLLCNQHKVFRRTYFSRHKYNTYILNIGALNHVRFRASHAPTLNYIESRTNPEPYMVQDVVHNAWRRAPCKVHGCHEPYVVYNKWRPEPCKVQDCHAPYVVHGGGSRIRTHVPIYGKRFSRPPP